MVSNTTSNQVWLGAMDGRSHVTCWSYYSRPGYICDIKRARITNYELATDSRMRDAMERAMLCIVNVSNAEGVKTWRGGQRHAAPLDPDPPSVQSLMRWWVIQGGHDIIGRGPGPFILALGPGPYPLSPMSQSRQCSASEAPRYLVICAHLCTKTPPL